MRAPRTGALLAVVLLCTALVGACTSGGHDDAVTPTAGASAAPTPATAVPVPLTTDGAVPSITIGVVVSASSEPGQGGDWLGPAEGAQVAAYRFNLDGATAVTLRVSDDQGTAEGAADAVGQLAAQGVSGVVLATSGSHVTAALDAADAAGLPALLPYETDPTVLDGHENRAWLTGPYTEALDAAVSSALSQTGVHAPFVVDAGGALPSTVSAAQSYSYSDGADTKPMTDALTDAAGAGSVDCVVIAGNAHAQATVVRAIEGTGTALPIILTPQARSSAFPAALVEAGGSLNANMTTVGVADSDPAALSTGERAGGLSAFLGAIRLMTQDPGQTDLFGAEAFSASSARTADARAHDAVVALVRAAEAAGSADPAKVGTALASLRLGNADGLAGADLTFTGRTALAPSSVVALTATSQDPGLRTLPGGGAGPGLFWFATSSKN